ncbi:nascent polypeptide-associated complex subunit alpha, muscle-specific form [Vulpes lagopus]|uniref:nascent polypeptide-associated complex subunit alpha, muscle-specific form n=1 Tax=Vulpes lagopus TaxID=494514 RepID=UPI001BC9DD52|nr:nascent polypeptide-associated complex subunit alpha, muscle-specific form [Vulpes lagopus]
MEQDDFTAGCTTILIIRFPDFSRAQTVTGIPTAPTPVPPVISTQGSGPVGDCLADFSPHVHTPAGPGTVFISESESHSTAKAAAGLPSTSRRTSEYLPFGYSEQSCWPLSELLGVKRQGRSCGAPAGAGTPLAPGGAHARLGVPSTPAAAPPQAPPKRPGPSPRFFPRTRAPPPRASRALEPPRALPAHAAGASRGRLPSGLPSSFQSSNNDESPRRPGQREPRPESQRERPSPAPRVPRCAPAPADAAGLASQPEAHPAGGLGAGRSSAHAPGGPLQTDPSRRDRPSPDDTPARPPRSSPARRGDVRTRAAPGEPGAQSRAAPRGLRRGGLPNGGSAQARAASARTCAPPRDERQGLMGSERGAPRPPAGPIRPRPPGAARPEARRRAEQSAPPRK